MFWLIPITYVPLELYMICQYHDKINTHARALMIPRWSSFALIPLKLCGTVEFCNGTNKSLELFHSVFVVLCGFVLVPRLEVSFIWNNTIKSQSVWPPQLLPREKDKLILLHLIMSAKSQRKNPVLLARSAKRLYWKLTTSKTVMKPFTARENVKRGSTGSVLAWLVKLLPNWVSLIPQIFVRIVY